MISEMIDWTGKNGTHTFLPVIHKESLLHSFIFYKDMLFRHRHVIKILKVCYTIAIFALTLMTDARRMNASTYIHIPEEEKSLPLFVYASLKDRQS
jgi:phenolic acid decarboxylase